MRSARAAAPARCPSSRAPKWVRNAPKTIWRYTTPLVRRASRREQGGGRLSRRGGGPRRGGDERQRNCEPEERLGKGAMDDRDPVLHQDDPETAQYPLDRDGEDGRDAKPADPAPALPAPEGGRQDERQEAHDCAEKPVGVLVEDPADHLRPWEEEHVGAERRGPGGDRQRGPRVGDQPADDDQEERRRTEAQGEAVNPGRTQEDAHCSFTHFWYSSGECT